LEDDVKALEEEVASEEIIAPEEDIGHDEIADATSDPSKHEPITFSRLMHYGLSPGCSACQSGEGEHTSSCRERFDRLIRGESSLFPRVLQKVLALGSLKEISSSGFTTSNARSSSTLCCLMTSLSKSKDLELEPPK
jgi:hypothetical protein